LVDSKKPYSLSKKEIKKKDKEKKRNLLANPVCHLKRLILIKYK
jgi:hypothetical protein